MFRKKTWLYSVIIGALSFTLVRIWQHRKFTMLTKPASEPERMILIDERTEKTNGVSVQSPSNTNEDDLKKIEGIGPKISSLLIKAGISKFEQLSNTDALVLEQILKNANLRLAKPATWPEQASYAARGDWEGLKVFQKQVKSGVIE